MYSCRAIRNVYLIGWKWVTNCILRWFIFVSVGCLLYKTSRMTGVMDLNEDRSMMAHADGFSAM